MYILVICEQIGSALGTLCEVDHFLVSVVRQPLYIASVQLKTTLMSAYLVFLLCESSPSLFRILD